MDDVTKRVNYFDRQFLRAADFQDETAYELDRRRRHNRFLHAPGVADGLTVAGKAGDTFVTVAPGTAYDDSGREIVLPQSQQPWQVQVPGGTSPVYLTIAYDEQTSDPSSDPGVIGYTRITENPTLAVSTTWPPDPHPNHALLLATITLDDKKLKISDVNTTPAGRRQAGVLPPNSVGANELADGSVTTSKILDGAVTQAKITPNSVSLKELKASVIVQGTITIPAPPDPNSSITVPGGFTQQPAGFYIPNILITNQPPQNGSLTVSWQDVYTTVALGQLIFRSRHWRITNESTAPVAVSYTIHKLEES